MDDTSSLRPIDAADTHPVQTVEIRARVPAQLRNQLDQLAGRSFRSLAGEVAAACSSWVEQHASSSRTLSVVIGGAALLSAAPALSQTCGALGSLYGISGRAGANPGARTVTSLTSRTCDQLNIHSLGLAP